MLGTASPSFKDNLEPFLVDFTEAVDDLFSTFMDTWEACFSSEAFLSRFLKEPSVVSEQLEAFSSVGDCAVSVSATPADGDKSPLVDVSEVREGEECDKLFMFNDDAPPAVDFTEVLDAVFLSSFAEPNGVCSLAATSNASREATEPFPVDLTDVRDGNSSSLSDSWEERLPMLLEEPALLTEERDTTPLTDCDFAASCADPLMEELETFSLKDEDDLSSADFREVREESFPSVTEDCDDRFLVKVDADPSSVDFRDA